MAPALTRLWKVQGGQLGCGSAGERDPQTQSRFRVTWGWLKGFPGSQVTGDAVFSKCSIQVPPGGLLGLMKTGRELQ